MRRIGYITDVRIDHPGLGPAPQMSFTAVVDDEQEFQAMQRRMEAGRAVGVSMSGTAIVHELTRWQTIRYRVGAWLVATGMWVRG